MKKFLLCPLLILLSAPLLSLPTGNPALPRFVEEGLATSSASWVNLRVGYEGDFVSDARLGQKMAKSGRIDTFEKIMNGGSATLSIRNRLDLYGIAGQVRYKGNWIVNEEDVLSQISTTSRYGYSWAAGTRIIFLEWGNATLSAGGRYQSARLKLSSLTKNGIPYAVDGARLKQREWQVDLGLGYKVKIFVPYVEGFYSKPKYFIGTLPTVTISDDSSSKLKMKKRNRFGLGVGCGITSGKACFINFEARLFNEEAATVSVDLRF